MLYYSSEKSDSKGRHCVYPALYGNAALKIKKLHRSKGIKILHLQILFPEMEILTDGGIF